MFLMSEVPLYQLYQARASLATFPSEFPGGTWPPGIKRDIGPF